MNEWIGCPVCYASARLVAADDCKDEEHRAKAEVWNRLPLALRLRVSADRVKVRKGE